MFAGLILILGALTLPGDAPAGPPTPVGLEADLIDGGARCRFAITGPPGAKVVLLVSPFGGGSAPSPEGRLVVQLWHPVHNFLRQGTLPADGRLVWRMKLPTDRARIPENCFLQVAALDAAPPHRVLGVSPAYRYRPGPPPALDRVQPTRSWWWLFLLLPLVGAALAPFVRRRPALLLVLPAAALVCLLIRPGPVLEPVRAALSARGRSDRALAAHLGPDLAAALHVIRTTTPKTAVIRMPIELPVVRGAPGYLESMLYPRQLVYRDEEARTALAAGRPVHALRPTAAPPPPGFTVDGAVETGGFRLLRLARSDGKQP